MKLLMAAALFLFLVACGSADEESKPEIFTGVEFIPAGTYSMSQLIASGETIPQDTTKNSVVVSYNGDTTRFELRGIISDGNQEYSCQPRVWTAKLAATGAANFVSRTEENCTLSISTESFNSLGRSYQLTDTGFVEKVTEDGLSVEFHYIR